MKILFGLLVCFVGLAFVLCPSSAVLADEGCSCGSRECTWGMGFQAVKDPGGGGGTLWALDDGGGCGEIIYTFELQFYTNPTPPAPQRYIGYKYLRYMFVDEPRGFEIPAGTGIILIGQTGKCEGCGYEWTRATVGWWI